MSDWLSNTHAACQNLVDTGNQLAGIAEDLEQFSPEEVREMLLVVAQKLLIITTDVLTAAGTKILSDMQEHETQIKAVSACLDEKAAWN